MSNISQVREELLATLADLRNREKPMEPERGNTIAKVAGVLVDSARVEVEYLKAINGRSSEFFGANHETPPIDTEGPRTVLVGGMYAQLGERS